MIKGEWWLAPTTMRTDGEGRLSVSGFRGDYRVAAGQGRADFALDGSPVTARLAG
jgi:hypothetical protein